MFKIGDNIIVNKTNVYEDEKLYRGLTGKIIRNIESYYKIKFCEFAENFINEYNAKNNAHWCLTPYIWKASLKRNYKFSGENE